MIKSSKPKPTVTDKSHQAAILLLATMADTTWRMFLPTIGGVFLGLWLDERLKTKIVFTLFLSLLGFVVGALLVMRQIKRINR